MLLIPACWILHNYLKKIESTLDPFQYIIPEAVSQVWNLGDEINRNFILHHCKWNSINAKFILWENSNVLGTLPSHDLSTSNVRLDK